MVEGVAFDGFAEDSEVVFGGGLFGLFDVVLEFGEDDGGEDAEDGDDDHEFNEGEGSLN